MSERILSRVTPQKPAILKNQEIAVYVASNGITDIETQRITDDSGTYTEVTIIDDGGKTYKFNVNDGKTPHIGDNGNWFVDGKDSRVQAEAVSIESVTVKQGTDAPGAEHVISIMLSNGKETKFSVYNGYAGLTSTAVEDMINAAIKKYHELGGPGSGDNEGDNEGGNEGGSGSGSGSGGSGEGEGEDVGTVKITSLTVTSVSLIDGGKPTLRWNFNGVPKSITVNFNSKSEDISNPTSSYTLLDTVQAGTTIEVVVYDSNGKTTSDTITVGGIHPFYIFTSNKTQITSDDLPKIATGIGSIVSIGSYKSYPQDLVDEPRYIHFVSYNLDFGDKYDVASDTNFRQLYNLIAESDIDVTLLDETYKYNVYRTANRYTTNPAFGINQANVYIRRK